MTHHLLVVPTGQRVGLTSVCLGIVRALDRLGVPFAFVKPIGDHASADRSTALVRLTAGLDPPEPISPGAAEDLLGRGDEAVLLEQVVERVEQASAGADVIVVEGVVPLAEVAYATQLNVAMAKALDAELVLVAAPSSEDPRRVAEHVDIAARAYGEVFARRRSCILNKLRALAGADRPSLVPGLGAAQPADAGGELRAALDREALHPLGIIPYEPELGALRVKELCHALEAEVLHEGEWSARRVRDIALCAANVRHSYKRFAPGTLLITPGDREDILLAVALAEIQGAQLAGLLLTGGRKPDRGVFELCRGALAAGLPVLAVRSGSFETASAVHQVNREVPPDDRERAELVMDYVASHLDGAWLKRLAGETRARRMTTPAFRHRLIERARAADRTIVLPEGSEPRTVTAAAICAERGIARCVLLADPAEVERVARQEGVKLPPSVRVVEPLGQIPLYLDAMVARRRHKGLTHAAAADQLEDTVVLGTMMLAEGDVDGLVSGAIHTTANTIRPALQLIKTAPGSTLVSSVFFMCLPEQVLVYGDCAVNPNPNAEELAEIALVSAGSAAAFGIEPRVAMISYSTGSSGAGADVEKVARATEIARARRPDLPIDGPLQYDAAAIEEVGRAKAPSSPVAGRATVFIFPDLNTGNTTYKAVQRSARVVSIGPMLQGLAKPVNDLSRGALVEDIVFTIALTAIQAARGQSFEKTIG
jgi:phosphate acetyltransferase